jgi:hypothetical protein
MIRSKAVLLLAIPLLLIACGKKEETTSTVTASPTTEASPTTAASPGESPTTAASPEMSPGEVEYIPVAEFEQIDVNKKGEITEADFITFYTEKADTKLTKEEAKKKFDTLDKEKKGMLTKEQATGEK